MPTELVLVHGESEWNASGLATGWADAPLTARGREQAAATGRWLAERGSPPDAVYTSLLARARETAERLVGAWGVRPPVVGLWRLNERHLGALQGLDKQTIKQRWGNAQRQRWRSDFSALPPPLHADDPRHPRHDRRYRHVHPHILPAAERIEDLRRQVLACWNQTILPDLRAGRSVTVVAHRDSLRVLIAELDGTADSDFASIQVRPAEPVIYGTCGKAPIPPSGLHRMCPDRDRERLSADAASILGDRVHGVVM